MMRIITYPHYDIKSENRKYCLVEVPLSNLIQILSLSQNSNLGIDIYLWVTNPEKYHLLGEAVSYEDWSSRIFELCDVILISAEVKNDLNLDTFDKNKIVVYNSSSDLLKYFSNESN